jgi:hypothetical protein
MAGGREIDRKAIRVLPNARSASFVVAALPQWGEKREKEVVVK